MSTSISLRTNIRSSQQASQLFEQQPPNCEKDEVIQKQAETISTQTTVLQGQQKLIAEQNKKINEALQAVDRYMGMVIKVQNVADKAAKRQEESASLSIRILQASHTAVRQKHLMLTHLSDVPTVLSRIKEAGQLEEVCKFHAKIEKKLVSYLKSPLPEKIEGEDESFRELVEKELCEVTEHLKQLRDTKQTLAERLQILVYDYIFPTKLSIGQLKNLALRKAMPKQIQEEFESIFSDCFESIKVTKEMHFFKQENERRLTWRIVLYRSFVQRISGGKEAFVRELSVTAKQADDSCNLEVIEGAFEASEQTSLDFLRTEVDKSAKLCQAITIFISCDGELLDEIIINDSQIISLCKIMGEKWKRLRELRRSKGPEEGKAGSCKEDQMENSLLTDDWVKWEELCTDYHGPSTSSNRQSSASSSSQDLISLKSSNFSQEDDLFEGIGKTEEVSKLKKSSIGDSFFLSDPFSELKKSNEKKNIFSLQELIPSTNPNLFGFKFIYNGQPHQSSTNGSNKKVLQYDKNGECIVDSRDDL
jgi:hypothetical protein